MTALSDATAGVSADPSITGPDILLAQLRVRLLAVVDHLRPTITDDQIYNAGIDIDELVAWLRAFQAADRASAATILMNDLTRLFSGLLMEPGETPPSRRAAGPTGRRAAGTPGRRDAA